MPTVDDLFHDALDLAPEERAAFIDRACGGDAELAREVHELLAAHGSAGGFMETGPAVDGVAGAADDPRLGTAVGAYRLLERIGSGGMGAVYRAERADRQFEQQVAIKVIKPGLDTEQMLARFQHERQLLANLVHPNITRLLDGGAADGTPYIVMEHVDGVRIDHFCNERAMPERERLELFLTVCAAVQHAHANLVVHRDLKPANILVTPDGTAKLLDFGIARVIDPDGDDLEVTVQTERRLTRAYASPELIEGAAPTTAADVYSLGVILSELLTGERAGSTGAADGRPAPSGDLGTIVQCAVQADPATRYGSVAALADDVRRYLDARPILARAPTWRDHARSFARRNPRVVGVGAVAAVLLLAAAVAVVVSAVSAIRSARVATRQARIAQLVNDFLNDDVLGAVDPDVTSDPNITIRDALDYAASRLDGAFPDEPLVEAALRATVGETYAAVGAIADSDHHLRRAIDLYETHAGPTDRATLDARADWVQALTQGADLDRARTEARALIETLDTHLGPDHALAAYARRSLASALIRQDRLDDAADVLEPLLARQRAVGKVDLTSTLHTLGRLRRLQSRLDEAADLIQEAVDRQAVDFGPESPGTLETRSLLGSIYVEQGRREEGLAIAESILAARRRVLGPEHPATLRSLNNVGLRLVLLKRHEEAEPVLREAFEAIERRRGPDHLHTLTAADNLAQAIAYLKRYDEAIPLRHDILARCRRGLGPDHRHTILALGNLATTLRLAGRIEEALPYNVETVEAARIGLGPNHWHVGAYLLSLARTLLELDRPAEAEAPVLEALAIWTERFEPTHPRIVGARKTAVKMYEAMGRPEEAARYRDPDG